MPPLIYVTHYTTKQENFVFFCHHLSLFSHPAFHFSLHQNSPSYIPYISLYNLEPPPADTMYKEVVSMYGYGYGGGYGGFGHRNTFVLVVVLFILLIIIGTVIYT
jgi:uncharacterized protein (TIGR01732 family)